MSIGEIITTIFLLFVTPAVATAGEQSTFRDSSGRTIGTAAPQGDGTVKFRDSQGRTTGTATTDSSGQTRYYDAQGRSIGTSTGPARTPFPERR
jgi:YD repeat-containing protein